MKRYFDHEKLDAYQQAIIFCAWAGELLGRISAKAAVKDQLDRASTSIPLNIAEGNGKFSDSDRSRYLEIDRGSALECAAALDVLAARNFCHAEEVNAGKERLAGIVRMLMGLLKRFSAKANVLREDEVVYKTDHDHEQDQDHEQA